MQDWYTIKNIDELDSPALVVFPDRVKFNIKEAIRMTGDVKRLRPHIKTHKSPEVCKLMLEAGITKFKCATIAEAEMLGQCQAPDVLLAYQPLGPKLKRFISLVKKFPGTQFSCLTDHKPAVTEQAAAFEKEGITVRVFIDLNLGMNRTGIVPENGAIALYTYAASLKGIEMGGLHGYDGHLRNPDFNARKLECDQGFKPLEEMKSQLESSGFPVPVVVAGGSPAFPVHCERKEVECSPGTFIYWDKGYSDICPEQSFLPAAVLVTRVISIPAGNRICLDLGHKSVGAENPIDKRISFLNATGLNAVSQSEEHLVLETTKDHTFSTGDVLYGLPFHVCPTVALYDSVYTIENGMATGEWKTTARDRKISI